MEALLDANHESFEKYEKKAEGNLPVPCGKFAKTGHIANCWTSKDRGRACDGADLLVLGRLGEGMGESLENQAEPHRS